MATSRAAVPPRPLRALLRLAASQAHLLAAGIGLVSVASLARLKLATHGGDLLDAMAQTTVSSNVTGMLLQLASMIFVLGVGQNLGRFSLRAAGDRLMADARVRILYVLLTAPLNQLDSSSTGKHLSLLTTSVQDIHEAATHHLPDFCMHLISFLFSAALMSCLSLQLSLLGAALSIAVGAFAAIGGTFVVAFRRGSAEAHAVSMSFANEASASARTIKAFGRESFMTERYAASVAAAKRACLVEKATERGLMAANLLLGGGAVLLVLYAGGAAVHAGHLSSGNLLSFAVYGVTAGHAANDCVRAFTSTMACASAAAAALALLDGSESDDATQVGYPRKSEGAVLADAANGYQAVCSDDCQAFSDSLPACDPNGCFETVFSEVCFTYPAASAAEGAGSVLHGSTALRGVSFILAAGSSAAIVGQSGCGKTTVLNLLLRLSSPTRGAVTLGGVPLGRVRHAWLREAVGIVSQEVVLFRGSALDNIAFGATDALLHGDAHVLRRKSMAAAVAAGAHRFILDAGGYDAPLGERGGALSGGQRQRIAIARALLRAPRLLLLDEATSALDAQSEAEVSRALHSAGRGRSVLSVTHRLAAAQQAQQIMLMREGRIAETGTHGELLASSLAYRQLFRLDEPPNA